MKTGEKEGPQLRIVTNLIGTMGFFPTGMYKHKRLSNKSM